MHIRNWFGAAALLSLAVSSQAATAPDVGAALEWRLVGPFRAGWATAVAGVSGGSDTFYMGTAGGGVWKSGDAGQTWQAVFDGVGSSSVGALVVSESNPATLYAGMGAVTSRYDIARGDGVYRSDDGGLNWRHLGLAASQHIGAIKVDSRDPNIALVAALGPAFGPGTERGVFRTTDGGATWQRTLFVSENTGAVDLAVDPEDARIVFASTWQVRYRPWLNYFTPDVGPESALYKSVDGGVSWQRLTGNGWPAGPLGRIGLAASHRAGSTRLWALVEAESGAGLYRSDDAGASWARVNASPEFNNGYFGQLNAVPDDPDAVFVMGRGMHRCTAGGTRCEIVKGAPGGDDYHCLWIDAKRPERRITGSDQGAVVTLNDGQTWSSWYNQPTGQFYKLSADNAEPYRIYGGQQDSGTVRIASRSDYGSIAFRDWQPVGGDERDYQLADPRNPDIVYSSGLGGKLSRWDARNGEVQNVTPWPLSSYGQRPTEFQQRYSWITPLAMSALQPYPLYLGSQTLWRSVDEGAHWEALGGDLSARDPARRACEGNLEPSPARACGYGVIWSIGLSARDNAEIWVGTDDGLVRVTRDGGKSWTDVTPRGLPAWAKVSTVEPSPTTPGSAYIAVDNHRQNDFRPLVFRTRDYGATWAAAVAGLPADHFVSVVRPDPVRTGLLYAGTETGAFVSFDDGAHWQSLQRNLPTAWVRDLIVHGDDLIAATQGRAIWVLDDLTPLRQFDAIAAGATAHLFRPTPAVRLRRNQNRDTPLPPEEPVGANPPAGAVIDYWLAGPAQQVELEIQDVAGAVVRRYASDESPPAARAERYFAEAWLQRAPVPAATAGMHRFVWDLRHARPLARQYEYSISTAWGTEVPTTPQGLLAAPGDYRVVLRADGQELSAPLTVTADPRVAVEPAAFAAAAELSGIAQAALARHYAAAAEVEFVRDRVKEIRALPAAGAGVSKALTAFEALLRPLVSGEGDRPGNLNLDPIGEALRSIETDIEDSDRAPVEPQRRALAETSARLERALALWHGLRERDLARLNARLGSAGLEAIVIPPVGAIRVGGAGASRELP